MKKNIITSLIFLLCLSTLAFAQRGKNGSLAVTATGTVVNAYTTLISDASVGAISISVANNTLSTHFSANLGPGDLILIIQMQGASIDDGAWWEGYGYINNYGNSGKYEFAQVLSVSGVQTINLTCGLTQNYSVSGLTQIVRVPRYTTLNINAGAELTCDTWNGSTGGVLVVETQGSVVINGSVNATGKGFRGGAASPQFASPAVFEDYANTDINSGGHKGEGIAGYGTATGLYCRGAAANGGGGGNSHNSGGGGGSNVGFSDARNGKGFPDTTTSSTYKTAWDLESANFHKNVSYGGGRGGYNFSYSNQDALTLAPGNTSWGGTYRKNLGGFGGWPLYENAGGYPRLFMGGGGGGGSANDNEGGAGGNGGGIIYFMVYGGISGTGTVRADGNVGGNAVGPTPSIGNPVTGNDAAGGGGGGGSIVLNAVSNIVNISAFADGGKGGDQVIQRYFTSTNVEAEGPGGGGGGGYIAISTGTISRSTNGGVNGTTNSAGMTEFPPNGATKGGPGKNNGVATNFTLTASNIMACQGQPVTLTANITGTFPWDISYGWYTSEFGGTLLSSNLTYTVNNPQVQDTFYFRSCPGTYSVPVIMYISPFVPDAGNNVSLCNGNSVPLQATGGVSFSWTPSTGLNSSVVPNPVCSATTTTLYSVTITNGDGCIGTDTVRVTVNPIPTVVVPSNIAVCNGGTVPAAAFTGAVPGTTFSWTNNDPSIGLAASGTGNIASFTAVNTTPNPVTATVSVSPSANSCTGTTQQYTITVNPTPTVSVPTDIVVCNGAIIPATTFTSPTSGTTYTWANSNTAIGISASGSGDIGSFTATNTGSDPILATITVTPSANTCTGIASTYTITVNPSPAVAVPSDITVCNGVTVPATAFTSLTAGSVFNWTNTDNSIGIGAGGTGDIPAFTATNTGTAPVTATISVTATANTCTGVPSVYTITVNPTPTVNVPADFSVCNGASVAPANFTSPVSGATFSWANSNTAIGLGASGSGDISGFTATNTSPDPISATITVTPSANTCPGIPSAYSITVNPSPAVSVPSDITVCNGATVPGTSFSSLTAGAVFNWTNTNAGIGIGASGAGDIPAFTAINTGTTPVTATITVTATANTCTGNSSNYTITVNPTPTANVPADFTVCNGAAVAAMGFTSSVSGTAFAWTNSNTAIGLAASGTGNIAGFNAINTGSVPITATITVTPSANSCSGIPSSYVITVNPTDNPSFNYSPAILCQAGSDPFANITGGSTGVFTSSPSGLIFLDTLTGLIDVSASGVNTYTVTFTTDGSCPSSATAVVSIIISPSAAFNYSGPYCHDAANPSPVLGAGAIAGTFTANPTGLVFVNSGTGQVDLAASNAGTYTVTNTIAATGSCPAVSDTAVITIHPVPSANVPANMNICNNGVVPSTNFTSNPAGSTFTWTNSNSTIGLGASGSGDIASFTAINTGTAPVTATISVTPTANGCTGTSSVYTITVNPTTTVVVPANSTVCSGDAFPATTFTSPTTGATFAWTNSNTGIGLPASGSGNIPGFTATNTGTTPITATITVTPSISGCAGTPSIYTITVNPSPTVTLTADISVCTGATIGPEIFTGSITGTAFTWTNSNTAIGLAASGTGDISAFTATNTGTGAISATITVTPSANACTGVPVSYTITVNPLPEIAIDSTIPGCPSMNNGTIIVLASGGTPPYTYVWNTGGIEAQLANLANGTYSVTVSDSRNCSDTRTVLFDAIEDCLDPVVYIPNIFSPNGDNQNDVFYVRGQLISSLHLMVFDRWGEKIFETEDVSEGWDGTYKGKEMPSDVYIYQAVITMADGTEMKKKGNISLVR